MATTKRISSPDIHQLYRQAFKEEFMWREILPPCLFDYFSIMAKGKSSPITVAIACLLSLTAAVCGPKTRIVARGDYLSPLNLYTLAVCDPGGGKTATFANYVAPVIEILQAEQDVQISLENYTTAGIQRHQIYTGGYGLIISDEGHRILSAINAKQNRGDAEKALLSKLWTGLGDRTTLVDKDRSFKHTSMSMCILIQPAPLVHEMVSMGTHDGFLDRLLFFTVRPRMEKSITIVENIRKLEEFPADVIPHCFLSMYKLHKDEEVIYRLSAEAMRYYCDLGDDYSDRFNALYDDSDSGKLAHFNCLST